MRIVIDPGHGGPFSGAVREDNTGRHLECRWTKVYANLIAARLLMLGHHVLFTPPDYAADVDQDLARRAEFANTLGAEVFISVHLNSYHSPRARGFEVFTSPGDTKADPLAQEIIEAVEFLGAMPVRADNSDGDLDKEAKFVVLSATKMPAVLIELGFMSNAKDWHFISSWATAADLAKVIAEAIDSWGYDHEGV